MLKNDKELPLETDCLASRIIPEKDFNYKCQFCTKICISRESFLRHIWAKHKDNELFFQFQTEDRNITRLKTQYNRSESTYV